MYIAILPNDEPNRSWNTLILYWNLKYFFQHLNEKFEILLMLLLFLRILGPIWYCKQYKTFYSSTFYYFNDRPDKS